MPEPPQRLQKFFNLGHPKPCRGVATNKALEDLFIAPFAVPKPPQRFYYIFQEPVKTAPEDLKDPAKIDALYRQVRCPQAEVAQHCTCYSC